MQTGPARHLLRAAAVWVSGRSIWVGLVAYAVIGFCGFMVFAQFVGDPVWQELFGMVWWVPAGLCAWWAKAKAEALSRRLTRGADERPRTMLTWPVVPPSPRANARKRYRVLAYDLNEEPAGEPPTQVAGEFDDAAEALVCARWVVERDMSAAGTDGTAAGVFRNWQYFGEGALIDGAPRVEFDCYEHARQHAQALASPQTAPKG